MLCFLDDGEGMSSSEFLQEITAERSGSECTFVVMRILCFPMIRVVSYFAADAADIVTFGRSSKRSNDSQLIGMYGNGLKS